MISAESIPQALRDTPHWLVWRLETVHGRNTKRPYIPRMGSGFASTSDSSTWGTFEQAYAVYQRGNYSGVGYVLTDKDPFAGVDLDHCVDPVSGDVADWAAEIAFDLNSYTEVTPSGEGLRVFVLGALPNGVVGRKKGNVELYCAKRFLTVTGQHVPKTPVTIEPRSSSIAMLYARYFDEPDERRPVVADYTRKDAKPLTDDEVVQVASRAHNGGKFRDLWNGNWESHSPSRSEADAALLGILAFYTQDTGQLDRLMCASGMARNKWMQRADYRERTIRFVLEGVTEVYSPQPPTPTITMSHLNGNGHKTPVPIAEIKKEEEKDTPEEGQAPSPEPEPEQKQQTEDTPKTENKWADIPISECGDGEVVDWMWEGYIAPGVVTSLTALWKSGKTTLLSHMLRAADGRVDEFIGKSIREMQVLVISEEHQSLWAERREELGLKDNISILSRPFMGRPTPTEWTAFCLYVAELVEKKNYTIVVFDTIFNLWCVVNENDNSEVIQSLRPLHAITAHEVAVLLLAHPTKMDQGEGKSTRGGGAYGGFVDVIMEMRRFDTNNLTDTRRTLTALSRYKDTDKEIVIELDLAANHYKVVGTRASVNKNERKAAVLAQLPLIAPGVTKEELHQDWDDSEVVRPSIRTLQRDLEDATLSGDVLYTGNGSRGNPKRFYRAGAVRLYFTKDQKNA